jgi:hypothetical protein
MLFYGAPWPGAIWKTTSLPGAPHGSIQYARRKRVNAPAALGHHLGLEGENPMRTLAPNSPSVQSEIDDAFIDAAIKFACPPLFDPLAGMDLSNLFKDVKPWPRRRHRAWTQRDITRLLRGAKAAGIEARLVIEAGRITLVPSIPIQEADASENPWEKFRRG